MGIIGEFIEEVVYEKFLKKLLGGESELIEALDPGRWGAPLSKGEAHYVNEIVSEEIHADDAKLQSGRELAEIYHEELKAGFGYFRQGWLAEYMADAFTPNAFQAVIFYLMARGGVIGETIADMMKLSYWTGEGAGSPPNGIWHTFLALFVWIPFFFYLSTVVVGAIISQGLFVVIQPAFYPLFFAWLITFVKWNGKYGLWLPFATTNTLVSAISFGGLWVTSLALVVRILNVQSWPLIGPLFEPMWQMPTEIVFAMLFVLFASMGLALIVAFVSIAPFGLLVLIPLLMFGGIGIIVAGFNLISAGAQTIIWPNLMYLGMGQFVVGASWPSVLLFWGLAGVGNAFYAEFERAHSEAAKRSREEVDKIVERLKPIIKES